MKGQGDHPIRPGDVLVLMGRGPMGAGMEEIYQITASLRHLSFGKYVAVLPDARFSSVSTGACIGHTSPEALAGGPLGKVRDGDLIRIEVDRLNLRGSLDLVEAEGREFGSEAGSRVLLGRGSHPQLSPDPELPDDTRLWAALQAIAGGTWGGCVYDTDAIIAALRGRA
ncbi:MAG TPA: dihydroxy-acid dehydratase [Isosphaeraceae bacterium]|nr:dihydroxy-acid dehydratase [Isosphaeraceae bacterium]